MPFSVHMLCVGDADAIILKYYDKRDREFVVLIDAGLRESGKLVEEEILNHTRNKRIDLAINTHPDDDHIGGFFYLIGKVPILEFWIHDPSKHKIRTRDIQKVIIAERLEKSLKYVFESLRDSNSILSLLDQNHIPRLEPFQDLKHNRIPITVLGPSLEYYEKKLDRFRDGKLLYEEQALQKSMVDDIGATDLNESSGDHRKLLDELTDRSNENNSSVILLLESDNDRVLFTADAGPEALNRVVKQYNLTNLDLLDVPHHGSRYSITSKLIDIFNPKIALISCGKSAIYPSLYVVNVLKEKGTKVYSTMNGRSLLYSVGVSGREGFRSPKEL